MDSSEKQLNRTLALAGVLQAAYLVKQLAWKGTLSQEELNTCVHSIFEINPASVEDVYGDISNLTCGLNALINLFSDQQANKDPEVARYTISLLHLERLLIKKPTMINLLQRGVERAKNQANHFGPTHENVIANLASVYTDTLSTFKFRIHVSGESTYLSNSNIVNKIRTLLLAGVRSAVLWRQLDGSRWQLVFSKRTLIQDAKYLLTRIKAKDLAHSD